jgi:hypothetical protein
MSEQIKVGSKIRNNLGPLTLWSASCQEKKQKIILLRSSGIPIRPGWKGVGGNKGKDPQNFKKRNRQVKGCFMTGIALLEPLPKGCLGTSYLNISNL